jgi:hypothetical protein
MALTDHLPISFEFSPKLGIRELPELDGNHQSNVSGLYVVGDLADAPIIKVALNQGFDVANRLCDELGNPSSDPDLLDVVVIGAGPAGIGAALALQARRLPLRPAREGAAVQHDPELPQGEAHLQRAAFDREQGHRSGSRTPARKSWSTGGRRPSKTASSRCTSPRRSSICRARAGCSRCVRGSGTAV